MNSRLILGAFYSTLISSRAINLFCVTFLLCLFVRAFSLYIINVALISVFFSIFIEELVLNLAWIFIENLVIFYLGYVIFGRYFSHFTYIFCLVTTIICAVDFFLLSNFSMTFNPIIIDALTHTNFNEATEFASFYFYFNSSSLKTTLIALISVVIVFVVIFAVKIKLNSHLTFIKIFCALCVILVVFDISTSGLKRLNSHPFIEFAVANTQYFYNDDEFVSNSSKIIESLDEVKVANSGIIAKNPVKNVIFIIGESLQRNHMSLYGYYLDTTPRLITLRNSGNLAAFSDVVSPESGTEASLRRVLNFSDVQNGVTWFESLNLVDLFALLGYKTAWISNQASISWANSAFRANASRTDDYFCSDKKSFSVVTTPDDVLLLPLREIKSKRTDKAFYVLHLNGSHVDYAFRYPPNFSEFTSKNIRAKNLSSDQKKKIAEYDNSVLFNDFIINKIYEIFKDEQALIIYLSDHGQTIYEDGRSIGHSTLRWGYEIPLIFIATDDFRRDFSDIWSKILDARDKKLMSDDLIHTICDILGVEPSEFKADKSILRPEFNEHRKRMTGSVDYDEKLKNQKGYELE